MPLTKYSLLFLGKADDPDCSRALEFCQQHFRPVDALPRPLG